MRRAPDAQGTRQKNSVVRFLHFLSRDMNVASNIQIDPILQIRRQSRRRRLRPGPEWFSRGLIRRSFGPLISISVALSALWADFLFRTPPRGRSTARERRVLASDERFKIETPVGRLAAWRGQGVKPPVLLLHGWGGHAGRLSEFVTPLHDAGFSVVEIDGPAHGESEGRRTTLMDFARALPAVARSLGPISGFIGHSMGATAAAIAMRGGLEIPRVVFLVEFLSARPELRRQTA